MCIGCSAPYHVSVGMGAKAGASLYQIIVYNAQHLPHVAGGKRGANGSTHAEVLGASIPTGEVEVKAALGVGEGVFGEIMETVGAG